MSQSLLSALEQDALKECMNIGASHAATALSQLVQEHVTILVPDLDLMPVERASTAIGKPDEVMSAVVMQMGGDVSGTMLLMFPTQSALDLSSILLKSKTKSTTLGDDE